MANELDWFLSLARALVETAPQLQPDERKNLLEHTHEKLRHMAREQGHEEVADELMARLESAVNGVLALQDAPGNSLEAKLLDASIARTEEHLNRGELKEAGMLLYSFLDVAEDKGEPSQLSATYGLLGRLKCELGEFTEALQVLNRSIDIAQQAGERKLLKASYDQLGNTFVGMGDFEGAKKAYNKSLGIAREQGDRAGIGICYLNLCFVFRQQGDSLRALEYGKQAVEWTSSSGDKLHLAKSYSNLGVVYKDLERYDEAEEMLVSAIELDRELRHITTAAKSILELASVRRLQGDLESATTLNQEALGIFRNCGAKEGIAVALGNIGNIMIIKGKYNEAIYRLTEAVKISDQIGSQHTAALQYVSLSQAYTKNQNTDLARRSLEAAKLRFDELGNRDGAELLEKRILELENRQQK